jgi:hypothetical protein
VAGQDRVDLGAHFSSAESGVRMRKDRGRSSRTIMPMCPSEVELARARSAKKER